ncbi:hypothetical protein D3C87_78200 [compost metagenome]
METYEGKVIDELVITWGGNRNYDLQIGYESIRNIFKRYEGTKIKLIIEEVSEDNG